jgi:hypothetical protein
LEKRGYERRDTKTYLKRGDIMGNSAIIKPEDGIRQLACAVILQAVRDYRGEGVQSTCGRAGEVRRVMDSAKDFLNNSESLRIWCAIAGISSSAIVGRIDK